MKHAAGRGWGKPVIEGVLWVYRKLRAAAYADVDGRHYQFKGNPIDTCVELDGSRWLCLGDVRRTVAGLPDFARLQRLYPEGLRTDGTVPTQRIEAQTLQALLRKAQSPETIRFLRWLEREVILPAQKRAGRATGEAVHYRD